MKFIIAKSIYSENKYTEYKNFHNDKGALKMSPELMERKSRPTTLFCKVEQKIAKKVPNLF